jgi:hypothetical protein
LINAASLSVGQTTNPPAAITVVSGNNQSGPVSMPLPQPLVAQVTDQYGNPVPGAVVNYTDQGVGGSFSANPVATDNTGMANVTYTTPSSAGSETINATVSGVATPASFSVSQVADAPAAITIVSGDNQSGPVSKPLPQPLVVKVTDQYGNTVSGVAVNYTDQGKGGSFSANPVATNSTGTASVTYTTPSSAGSETVNATVSGVATAASFSVSQTLPVPAIPKNLRADISVGTTGQLFVSWNAVSGATYYNLQRSTNAQSSYAIVSACSGANNSRTLTFTGSRACRDGGLTVGTYFYYEVQACNANGCSSFSTPVSNAPVACDCTPAQMPNVTGAATHPEVALVSSTVDPAVTFLPSAKQYVGYAASNVPRRGLLVVNLPGSNSSCSVGAFSRTAEALGFETMCVNYSNVSSEISMCGGDPDCFGNVSQAKLDATGNCSVPNGSHCGKDPTTGRPYVNSNPADAVAERVSMMLQYLNNHGYNAYGVNWGSYLSGTTPLWNKIIIGGFSQGGSVATFAGYEYPVVRVFNLSSPPQATSVNNVMIPATYFSNVKITDIRQFYGLVSTNDLYYQQGRYSAAWSALGFTSTNNDAEVQLNTSSPTGLNCNSGIPSHNFSTSAPVSPGGGHTDPLNLWNEDVFKFMLID